MIVVTQMQLVYLRETKKRLCLQLLSDQDFISFRTTLQKGFLQSLTLHNMTTQYPRMVLIPEIHSNVLY